MNWQQKIFSIKTENDFLQLALEIFRFQAKNNKIYSEYLHYLNRNSNDVKSLEQIPFLPIEFFKSRVITSVTSKAQKIFTSSGTTGGNTSCHHVSDLKIYEESFNNGFKYFYGSPENYCILALLPSYLEREGSSLIYMMDRLIKKSNHPNSGFYLNNLDDLVETLSQLQKKGQKVLLLGVSFALLDLAEKFHLNLKDTIVMETGGMKGQRKEITREELHSFLCSRLGVTEIHSEYGMTELLSQAYSKGRSLFATPPWMKVIIRDAYDPFSYEKAGRSGGINIIDLANVNSCSFIETQDLGKLHEDGNFEVLGRFDHSDIRGCNLLINE